MTRWNHWYNDPYFHVGGEITLMPRLIVFDSKLTTRALSSFPLSSHVLARSICPPSSLSIILPLVDPLKNWRSTNILRTPLLYSAHPFDSNTSPNRSNCLRSFDLSRNPERERGMESDVLLIEIAWEDDSRLQLPPDDAVSSSSTNKTSKDDAFSSARLSQPLRSKPFGSGFLLYFRWIHASSLVLCFGCLRFFSPFKINNVDSIWPLICLVMQNSPAYWSIVTDM